MKLGMTVRKPHPFDRIIDTIEWLAAMFVGIVAANIFIAVMLRKFFGTSIPDSYDFGRLLLGILIFWGIAATSYRGGHITVDLLWTHASPRYKRWIDVFAYTINFHHKFTFIMNFVCESWEIEHVILQECGIRLHEEYGVAREFRFHFCSMVRIIPADTDDFHFLLNFDES